MRVKMGGGKVEDEVQACKKDDETNTSYVQWIIKVIKVERKSIHML